MIQRVMNKNKPNKHKILNSKIQQIQRKTPQKQKTKMKMMMRELNQTVHRANQKLKKASILHKVKMKEQQKFLQLLEVMVIQLLVRKKKWLFMQVLKFQE